MKPIRQRFPQQTRLTTAGAGSVSVTARADFRLLRYRVTVVTAAGGPPANQSTALITINGDEFDGSETGNNDASDTGDHVMLQGDELVCTWSAIQWTDINAMATLTLWGLEYPGGTGLEAIYGV